MDNPNAPDCVGEHPIITAAENGHVEVIKFLAPLTDNPNAPNIYGETPISIADNRGYTNIVKVLKEVLDEQKLKQDEENDNRDAKDLQRSMDDEDILGEIIFDPSQEDEDQDDRQLPILKRGRFNMDN